MRRLQVLNKAVKDLPTEPVLHIIAAKLQEAQGTNPGMVRRIISRAIKDKLPKAGVIIDRETWLREAETAEKAVPPMVATCRAIVKEVVDVAVDDHDRKDTYHRDAAEAADRGCVETARAILEHACESFPTSETSWRAAADLEKRLGARAPYSRTPDRPACGSCPACSCAGSHERHTTTILMERRQY